MITDQTIGEEGKGRNIAVPTDQGNGTQGVKWAPGNPRGPKGGGKEGNPRALWEGDGTIWIYSEAIPNGKLS